MLKVKLSNGVIVLGIDAENVRRLQAEKPMVLDLAEVGGTDKICIIYGETITKIMADLGIELPENRNSDQNSH